MEDWAIWRKTCRRTQSILLETWALIWVFAVDKSSTGQMMATSDFCTSAKEPHPLRRFSALESSWTTTLTLALTNQLFKSATWLRMKSQRRPTCPTSTRTPWMLQWKASVLAKRPVSYLSLGVVSFQCQRKNSTIIWCSIVKLAALRTVNTFKLNCFGA